MADLTLRSSGAKPGSWTLGFTIPGAAIRSVWGARWQPDAGGDGGVASGQFLLPQSSATGTAGAAGTAIMTGSASIVIMATGTPGRPTGCTFDGTSCTFS
jgi:hypothetical protein